MTTSVNSTDIAIVGMAARLPDDPFEFDARFFGCTDTEAAELDPQHRLFLECAYHAMERAGRVLDRWDGVAGIYGATNLSWYYLRHVYPRAGHDPLFGNTPDGLVTRAAYELNATGPCVTVQAACASSLVAVHMACQDLLSYQCDLAVAGGVSVDDEGAGTGVVVLRRLADALASGDHVHAVIKGSAVANDGRRRVGPASCGSAGAREAALAALAVAGLEPEDVGHVEPHRPGDAAEAALWDEVYPMAMPGSASSTELGQAAAVVSLIRTALAVEHGWEPSVPGFPAVGSMPDGRLAGVAASGSGGVHAHVVLGQAPRRSQAPDDVEWHLLPFSAKTPAALGVLAEQLREHLRVNEVRMADVAHTLRSGRRELGHRTFAVCRDGEFEVAPVTRPDFASLVFSFTGESIESDVLTALRLMNAGIRPVAVLGTGFGEYAAACVAGTLTLDEALALAKARESPESYEKAVCNAQPRAGELPLLSGATGAVVTEDEVTDQRHWLSMVDDMCPAVPAVSAFVVEVSTAVDEPAFLALVGSVWARGAEVDWDALSSGAARRVPLPGYPFERQRYHLP
ncbi:type I polyketide synthase [Lentzea tibetensis]|uniref:Type I polyketide synthase n=1 Tax=Lentzea tibetensis TaxID=2591470 RepID=A0A563EJ74_9PSEU|nr:beta-ketoacyl synthase N-terminal-like domain-containing protein [Lentzea tibetensis]TWP46789.1 type I polyketide synthase [Lentzea tibetensis]